MSMLSNIFQENEASPPASWRERRSTGKHEKHIAFEEINKQADFVRKILKKNKLFITLLNLLKDFGLTNWYIGGGAIGQIVWNYFHHYDPNFGINDFDVVYFDSDFSYEAEDKFIKKVKDWSENGQC